MGWLFARLYDPLLASAERECLGDWREELLSEATGDVLEIGAGSGVNLRHYRPQHIARLVVAEPESHMRAILRRRVSEQRGLFPIEISDAPAESLQQPAESFDVVVSTLVLCSVGNVEAALSEIARVLRPGGKLIFLEHVAADPGSALHAWQVRFEPLWRRVAGNCHLTRQTEGAIRAAGLSIVRCERDRICKAIPLVRPSIRGVAVRPETSPVAVH